LTKNRFKEEKIKECQISETITNSH